MVSCASIRVFLAPPDPLPTLYDVLSRYSGASSGFCGSVCVVDASGLTRGARLAPFFFTSKRRARKNYHAHATTYRLARPRSCPPSRGGRGADRTRATDRTNGCHEVRGPFRARFGIATTTTTRRPLHCTRSCCEARSRPIGYHYQWPLTPECVADPQRVGVAPCCDPKCRQIEPSETPRPQPSRGRWGAPRRTPRQRRAHGVSTWDDDCSECPRGGCKAPNGGGRIDDDHQRISVLKVSRRVADGRQTACTPGLGVQRRVVTRTYTAANGRTTRGGRRERSRHAGEFGRKTGKGGGKELDARLIVGT